MTEKVRPEEKYHMRETEMYEKRKAKVLKSQVVPCLTKKKMRH